VVLGCPSISWMSSMICEWALDSFGLCLIPSSEDKWVEELTSSFHSKLSEDASIIIEHLTISIVNRVSDERIVQFPRR
jgi:hypothetical protein